MTPCPCKNCVAPKRHSGCHGHCKEYIEWNEIHKQELELIQAKRHEEEDCFPNRLRGGKMV
jgi:hypothetical protein